MRIASYVRNLFAGQQDTPPPHLTRSDLRPLASGLHSLVRSPSPTSGEEQEKANRTGLRRSERLLRLLAVLVVPPAILAGCTSLPQAQTHGYTNPILYADYSDPDVVRVDDSYYLVASSFHWSPGIPVLKSEDLVHWKIIGHVLPSLPFGPDYDMPGPYQLDDTKSKPVTGTKYASGVWAPSIRHHEGKFYVYWATPDEGVFMATASDPAGPWTPAVAVIAQKGLEDPCPYWDDDGQAWLVHGKVGAGPLVLHRMSWDGTQVLDEGKVIAEDKVRLPILEGPKFYKRNGWYYIFAPIGGVGTGPQAVGRARSIEGPYEWKDVLVPGNGLLGPHQGGYVETPSGQGWFIHFNSTGAFGRIDHLQPMQWVDDWPIMGDNTLPVLQHTAPDTGKWRLQDRLQESDEFLSPALGLQWSFNHNPDNTKWSLSERPGFLRLKAGAAQHLTTSRNTVTQILQGPHMQATTRIDVSGMVDGQRAGLTLFGVKPVWIGVVKDAGVTRVTFASAGVETSGPVITGSTIDLKAWVTPDQMVRFEYDTGSGFTALGEPTLMSKFSWWKGSRPGVFTFVKGDVAPDNHVDVDWFRVTHEVTP